MVALTINKRLRRNLCFKIKESPLKDDAALGDKALVL